MLGLCYISAICQRAAGICKNDMHRHLVRRATMNALLIWPRIPVTYWGGHYSIGLIGKRAFMPPLGLLTVAALCPADWTLRLVDLNAGPLSDSDLEWADMVLMSGMVI